MQGSVAFIGFGEAAITFRQAGMGGDRPVAAYDRKTGVAATRAAKLKDYRHHGVSGRRSCAEALNGAGAILSLVTADQSLAAAREAAAHLAADALWLDMNSVAPTTKRATADVIEAAGGRYVDVAIMAPVRPAALAVPLWVCGPHAKKAADTLSALGFSGVRRLAAATGTASAVKMIRSVLIKGLEALTTECAMAAQAAGVLDDVVTSLNAVWPGTDWGARAGYNLERMLAHGTRRAAELEEVARTLADLRVDAGMTGNATTWHRALGALDFTPSGTLGVDLDAVRGRLTGENA